MEYVLNELGQPVGVPMPDWQPPPHPPRTPMQGRYCRLEPLDPVRHAQPLYEANALDREGRNWTYLPYGPFEDFQQYRSWLEARAAESDPLFSAICGADTGAPIGVASYLRIMPKAGSIEVGHLNFSPRLQRSRAATEAMYLMMERAFGLGYRRYEWKCNALNMPSRQAAERLGFTFEGISRQAVVYKGRNRDTAWFSIIDREWPMLRAAFLQWLAPSNFDADGRQRQRLYDLIQAARQAIAAET